MLQRNTIFTPIFVCIILVVAVLTQALSADSGTYWLLVDATPNARAHEPLNLLTKLLTSRGQVPSDQIHHLEGENATPEEIHAQLQEISGQTQAQDTLIFLFHGSGHKTKRKTCDALDDPGKRRGNSRLYTQ